MRIDTALVRDTLRLIDDRIRPGSEFAELGAVSVDHEHSLADMVQLALCEMECLDLDDIFIEHDGDANSTEENV